MSAFSEHASRYENTMRRFNRIKYAYGDTSSSNHNLVNAVRVTQNAAAPLTSGNPSTMLSARKLIADGTHNPVDRATQPTTKNYSNMQATNAMLQTQQNPETDQARAVLNAFSDSGLQYIAQNPGMAQQAANAMPADPSGQGAAAYQPNLTLPMVQAPIIQPNSIMMGQTIYTQDCHRQMENPFASGNYLQNMQSAQRTRIGSNAGPAFVPANNSGLPEFNWIIFPNPNPAPERLKYGGYDAQYMDQQVDRQIRDANQTITANTGAIEDAIPDGDNFEANQAV